MQLTYRGSRYNTAPTCSETTEIEFTGLYRGTLSTIASPVEEPTHRGQKLTYRGIQY